MGSNRKSPLSINLLASLKTSLIFSSDTLSTVKHHFFPIAVLIGLLVLMGFIPIQSIAASTEHPFSSLSDGVLITQVQSNQRNLKSFARGRILAEPRAGLPAHAFAKILEAHDGKARKIGQSNLYIIDVPEYSEEGVIARLKHHPHLKFVELDYSLPAALVTDDPYFGNAWHLPKIGAPLAWDYSQGDNITIAVLDTGVDSTHPDLKTQIVSGWNIYDNNPDTSDIDPSGHGTAVAGIAAAANNNGIGVSSVTGKSKVMPIRITDSSGWGYVSTIAQGLTYAADRGARVANVSFQGVTNSSTTRNAAQYMKDKNGLVVVAAGNTGNLESFTATTSMITVSATDSSDLKARWSSYGNYVSISAPGSFIWTTKIGGDYRTSAGTSSASPVVAGVVALMMSANPTLSSTDVENLLFSTTVDLGDPGRDPYYGYGRVDAAAAVRAAAAVAPSIDTEAPTISFLDPLSGATVTGLVPVDIEASDNVGVIRAELWVNNTAVAVDTSTPFAFSWDSSGVPNGVTNLVAYVFDTAGNKSSSTVEVTVNNVVEPPLSIGDTEPPIIYIINPVAGNISGSVTISVDASDNYGASGITQSIFIDGILAETGTGSTLAFSWNTRSKKVTKGMHTIQAVAKDAAGNTTSTSVNVNVIK